MPVGTVYSILLKKENAHDDPIYCCSWLTASSQGDARNVNKNYIATGGLDGLVKLWIFENERLQLLYTLDGHNSMAVVSVAISSTAQTIASSSLDSKLMIWDMNTGEKIKQLETTTDVWKLTYSPDGNYVATGGHTGKILIYGVDSGLTERTLDTRGKFALSVTWSPDGKLIASGSEDGIVSIMDVEQRKVIHSISAHARPARCVAFAPCARRLATAANDGIVNIYDVASGNLQHKTDLKSWALHVCFSADGARLAAAAADGSVRVLLAAGLSTLNSFKEHTDMVWGVHFNAVGNKLLSVSKDRSMIIYECPPPPKPVKK